MFNKCFLGAEVYSILFRIFPILLLLSISLNTYAATPANTLITNQVTVEYNVKGFGNSTVSNQATFRVLEVVDHSLVTNHPSGLSAQSPSSNKALSFSLSNLGNGNDSYQLSTSQSTTDDFDATNVRIYLDADDNGIFDLSSDTLYIFGSNNPTLAAGDSIVVFIVSDIPGSESDDNQAALSLLAQSSVGTGSPGDLFSGAGDGGVDAVLGAAGGTSQDSSFYKVSALSTNITKSQSVLDPQGGSKVITNSIITYTLNVEVAGSGSISNVMVRDTIPANSEYVTGSLTLNSVPLTDASDTDQGVFNGSEIQVSLGTVVSPTTTTVTFKVRIL